MAPDSPVKMASPKEAASYLERHEDTLARWRKRTDLNGLPFHQRPNGKVEYEWDDLHRWKAGHRREPEE